MKLLRHPVAAVVIFAMLISLMLGFWNGLQTEYGLVDTDTQEGFNIVEALKNIDLMQAVDDIAIAGSELSTPENIDLLDLLGAISAVGIGVVKLVFGVMTAPVQILSVVLQFFYLPPPIATFVSLLTVVYIVFIILSTYVKGDV